MIRRHSIALAAVFLMGLMLTVQGAAAQTTYTITVKTDSASYASGQQIKISGAVSPAPGPSTGVTLRIFNPSGQLVRAAEAGVSASTGAYNSSLVAGGSPEWTIGLYKVNATWGAFPPTIFKVTTFNYTASTTTTTTTSTTTTTTTTTTPPTTTTSSTASTTSTTSSTPTSTSTTTSSTKTSAVPSTSTVTPSVTSSSSTTAVPEFPYQWALAGMFVTVIVVAYLFARKARTPSPSTLRNR